MDENARYLLRVDEWVLKGIQSGFSTIAELATELPGVYPTLIRDSINRLSLTGEIPRDFHSLLSSKASPCLAPAFSPTDQLPIPHPLDFEWRFSWEASQRILQVARKLAKEKDEILLLSTPSVFYYAIQKKNTSFLRYVGDKTPVTEFLCGKSNTEVKCDFLTANPNSIADAGVVIIDPPWYEEFLHSFMWLAATSCKNGGYVILSFPPEGTRPGVMAEWLQFLKFADHLGMTLVVGEEGFVAYDSPFFEVNALHVEGISVPRTWRKGVMRVFKKVAEVQIPKPVTTPSETWKEVQFDSVRLKLRQGIQTDEIDPRLTPVIPGEIFPSVSRRDPRRQLANVWSSGNRIFKCRRPDILEPLIIALEQHQRVAEAVDLISREFAPHEKLAVEETVMQLSSVIEKERKEFLSLIFGTHDI